MTRWLTLITLILCCGLSSPAAFAHKASDSYLTLTRTDQTITGQWDIALRDLDYAIGLDRNDDGAITWGELRAQHEALTAYALSRFEAKVGGQSCSSRATEHLVDSHTDGAYAVIRFRLDCPSTSEPLVLRYNLFFDLDPLHRGLLRLEDRGATRTAVFAPDQRTFRVDSGQPSVWREFVQFGREGVWHIWIGFDHVLFLLSLLLPSVLWWDTKGWQAVRAFRPAFWEVFKIVTAFTVAHSITLSLAVLGDVTLPSRLVESAIAASVLVVALNNLYPIIQARLWMVAFGFGLVHGLGFASVLIDLGLPATSLLIALAAFNLGVEGGQLVIVSAFLPLAYLARSSWFYQRLVVGVGSAGIVLLAFIWLLERSLNWDIGVLPG